MISVYNESLICDCDGAEILRPRHFVVVCELTSIHDDILSSGVLKVLIKLHIALLFVLVLSS